jgi:hypothetical protein
MGRVKKGSREQREKLETALGEMAVVENCLPRIELRVRQAIRRAGLSALLQPALDDLSQVIRSTQDARQCVIEVTSQCEER